MKKIFVLVLLLTGCVNYYDYRHDEQLVSTYQTNKAPVDFSECLLGSFQRTGKALAGGTMQKEGSVYSVLLLPDAVDSFAESGKTTVKYYSFRKGHVDIWNGIDLRESSIKSCL